jgi:hypothetical protein
LAYRVPGGGCGKVMDDIGRYSSFDHRGAQSIDRDDFPTKLCAARRRLSAACVTNASM